MPDIYNYLVEIGIILLIIITPIYFGSVDLKAITSIELTILFMLMIWVIGSIIQGNFVFRRTPLDIFILLFCAYSTISTLFFSRYIHTSYMGLSQVLCFSALYFIVVNNIKSKNQLTRLIVAIILVGFANAFIHLIKNASVPFKTSIGMMLNVGNHFAGYMVIIIPFTVAMSFVIKDIGKRVLLIFAGIIMASAMIFSLVVGSIIAFIFSLIIVAILFAGSQNTQKQALILGAVVFCSLFFILWFGYKPVYKELMTVSNMETGSAACRLSLWKSTSAMFADKPITGTGLGTFDYIYPKYRLADVYSRAVYTHNDWLQLLAELGIIGFIIIVSGMAVLFIKVCKRLNLAKHDVGWTKGLIVGGLSSIGAGVVHALVDFNFHIPAIAVLFTIIIAITVIGHLSYSNLEQTALNKPDFRKVKIPIVFRVASAICLFLIVGLSGISIIRPCIADNYYQNGMKLEEELFWEEAIEKYQSAINLSSGNSDYFYALGNVYAKRMKLTKATGMQKSYYKLAFDAYDQAIKLCPTYGDYHLALGSLNEIMGNMKEAKTIFTKAISLDPNNAFYHRIYGGFCLRHGETQRAIMEYKKSLEVYPDDFANIFNDCCSINSDRLLLLDIARRICPQEVKYYVTLAQIYGNKGWYEDAFSEYRKAIALAPEQIDLWKQLSKLLVQQGNLDETVVMWHEFIKSHSQNAQAHINLASVYVLQDRLDDAIQQYLVAANIDRGDSNCFLKVADLYMQQGKSAEALRIWQNMIKQKPYSSAMAHYCLGKYYEIQGEWISALDSFQQAIALEPKNIAYRLHLANSYCNKEMFYEAIREWEQVLKLKSDNITAHLQLARIYQQSETQDKAKEHYQQVLKLQPDNIEAKKALSGLM
jgi:tetratricopeptide (TPR) repeat protein/O-antigen ligase